MRFLFVRIPFGDECFEPVLDAPRSADLIVVLDCGPQPRREGWLPDLKFLKKTCSASSLVKAFTIFQKANKDLRHHRLCLLVPAVCIEEISRERVSSFASPIECLESTDKTIGVLTESNCEDGDASPHGKTDFLVSPMALVKVGVEEGDKRVA